MRHRGRVLSREEIVNGPVYLGCLQTYSCQSRRGGIYRAVCLLAPDNNVADHLLPDLYEPVLVGIGNGIIRLRGFERWKDAQGTYSVIQEWHCETGRPG